MAKIMIINDNKTLAEEWAVPLRAEGYEVVVYSTIFEVLRYPGDVPNTDLAIVGLMMPCYDVIEKVTENDREELESLNGKSGLWICKRLREKKPTLTIIFTTIIHPDEPDAAEILKMIRDAGTDKILYQPFSNDILCKAVAQTLESHSKS